ncbi:pectin lyase-like superfamily protein [Striga asiatica]|uniref:Pectin lyase-like superfamily protein n=1 Tax=Striga asiatica TaxID=4170 RepID=A0A5A7QSQ4_STRAF|nr:pectin lyase-like superfamily protein [Striga asiatica]
MDSYSFLLFLFLLSIWKHLCAQSSNINFSITDFGAVPDRKTDSSKALESAWQKACQVDGGSVWVPTGTFFVRKADLNGPCNGQTLFEHRGTVIASDEPTLGSRDSWIAFTYVDDLTLVGDGTFDGNGAVSWSHCHGINVGCKQIPPYTLKVSYVRNALIGHGLRFVDSKGFHLFIYASDKVHVEQVHIWAPGDSPNTDGVHIALSNNTRITDSIIGTGDDCVSIGDGCTGVNVTGVWCGPGHGISIGSLGKYEGEGNVAEVTLKNCTFDGTENGVRIKTWAQSLSSSVVSGVTVEEIVVKGASNPIIIDQFYCPGGKCTPGWESSIQIKGVKFAGVKGMSATEASISLNCSKSHPCQDIEFFGLNLTYANGQPSVALCANADGKFGGSQVPSRCST